MKNPGIKFGLRVLIISIIWTLLEHFAGLNTTNHELGQYTRMLPSIIFYAFIFIAILKTKQDNINSFSFSYAFKTGITVTIVYSIGISAWYALYGEAINTQYKPTLLAFERAKLEAAGASAENIAAELKHVDLSSGGSVVSYLLLFAVMFTTGLIVTIIMSAIFGRKAKKAN